MARSAGHRPQATSHEPECVEDPFGRRARFTYTAAGQLASITDVAGLTSSFGYGPDDFVNTLMTPYGTTSFRHEPSWYLRMVRWFIEATDALGGTEHLEFQYQTPSLAVTAPPSEVPVGFENWNTNLDYWNSFYWNQRAWALGPDDLTQAVLTHWLLATEWPMGTAYSVTVPHSVKRPLEGRVWYAYPGQTTPSSAQAVGWWREASRGGAGAGRWDVADRGDDV